MGTGLKSLRTGRRNDAIGEFRGAARTVGPDYEQTSPSKPKKGVRDEVEINAAPGLREERLIGSEEAQRVPAGPLFASAQFAEPWRMECRGSLTVVLDANGEELVFGVEEERPKLARMVACVNYCAVVPTRLVEDLTYGFGGKAVQG